MLIDLYHFSDFALLALRIIVAVVFISSGLGHVKAPEERGKSIEMSSTATFILGAAEIFGALSVALGIYIQIGAVILIIVMLGAIYKKIFVWGTGFYSDEGFGWHYDLILLLANVVFLTTSGNLVLAG